MDDDADIIWRGLCANLANAAHRLRLTVVNLASDPSVPEAVRRSPSFLAAVRDAELVEAFLDRWRVEEGTSSAELVFRLLEGRTSVTFNTDNAKAWLFGRLPEGWTLLVHESTVTMDPGTGRQLLADAKADDLVVFVVEA